MKCQHLNYVCFLVRLRMFSMQYVAFVENARVLWLLFFSIVVYNRAYIVEYPYWLDFEVSKSRRLDFSDRIDYNMAVCLYMTMPAFEAVDLC